MAAIVNKFFEWIITIVKDYCIVRENGEIVGYIGFDGLILIEEINEE